MRSPAGAQSSTPQLLLAVGLFLATLATTTTFGAGFYLSTRTDVVTDLVPAIEWVFLGQLAQFLALTDYIFRTVWSDGQLLQIGLAFSLPTLAILLSHELGHYVACRRNNLPSSYPYFIPAPFLIGTFGAFIRIRAPIRTRRELLEVGAAGPIAGFVVLLPILLYGIATLRTGIDCRGRLGSARRSPTAETGNIPSDVGGDPRLSRLSASPTLS